MSRILKKLTLTRHCFLCGKIFEAIHTKNIFCCKEHEFENWKEASSIKVLKQYWKLKANLENKSIEDVRMLQKLGKHRADKEVFK